MTQHVREHTHDAGNVLDLVICQDNDSHIKSVSVADCDISDHRYVSTILNVSKAKCFRRTTTYRKTKSLDIAAFEEHLINVDLLGKVTKSKNVCEMIEVYNSITSNALDELCPLVTRKIVLRPNKHWYTAEISDIKRKVREAEKNWRWSRLEVDRQMYATRRKEKNLAVVAARTSYLKTRIALSRSNTKDLYKIVNEISNVNPSNDTALPNSSNQQTCADNFSKYFTEKINTIRTRLDESEIAQPRETDVIPTTAESTLDGFTATTEAEIETRLRHFSKKTSSLDPIPSWVVLA